MDIVDTPIVYDNPKKPGIVIEFPITKGMSLTVYMDDDVAQGTIDIIQNKLNARVP